MAGPAIWEWVAAYYVPVRGIAAGMSVVAAGIAAGMLALRRAHSRPRKSLATRTVLVVGTCAAVAGILLVFEEVTLAIDVNHRADQVRALVRDQLPEENKLARRLAAAEGGHEGGSNLRRAALDWIHAAPFGIFIHYGPSSLLAAPSDREWWRKARSAGLKEAAADFRPSARAVESWAKFAKAAGASYIVVTMKHHDGYGLWDSGLTNWDVGSRHDLLRPLASACRRNKVRLFVYYSVLDWHELLYRRGRTNYLAFVEGQIRELMTRYGEIAGVWFDGTWDRGLSPRQLTGLYELIHRLQPWALVGANHHGRPGLGEDFQIFEGSFPGQPGEGGLAPVSSLPHQSAVKLGPTWFWSGGPAPTSGRRLRDLRARARTKHVSLLVDVAPRPDGRIPRIVWQAVAASR